MANSVRKPRTKFSDANLVPEALEHKLNVLEDPPLISLLGREKFVELAVFGRLGWQNEVSDHIAFGVSRTLRLFLLPGLLQFADQGLGFRVLASLLFAEHFIFV